MKFWSMYYVYLCNSSRDGPVVHVRIDGKVSVGERKREVITY